MPSDAPPACSHDVGMSDLVPRPPPEVGARAGDALWRISDTRERTLGALADIDDDWVDRGPDHGRNTIGSILYHIAAIELDWVFSDVLREDFPADFRSWFPVDVRDATGRLAPVLGESLDRHGARLSWTREHVLDRLSLLDDDAFVAPRVVNGRRVSPVWVLHHLTQHEAEHRGQIQALITAFSGDERSS
jgi:hypothetical protein